MGGIGRDESDALNFDVIFSDDAGGRCFGGKRAGGTCCAFDVEKRDALSIRRESRRVDVAVEFGEADGGLTGTRPTPGTYEAVFQIVLRKVAGFCILPVTGFFTIMGPNMKLLTVSAKFGLDVAVENGMAA